MVRSAQQTALEAMVWTERMSSGIGSQGTRGRVLGSSGYVEDSACQSQMRQDLGSVAGELRCAGQVKCMLNGK